MGDSVRDYYRASKWDAGSLDSSSFRHISGRLPLWKLPELSDVAIPLYT